MVECNNMTILVHGCGNKTATLLEGYASAGIVAPFEISKIQEISWIKLNKESLEKLETLFDIDCVSLTQQEKEKS